MLLNLRPTIYDLSDTPMISHPARQNRKARGTHKGKNCTPSDKLASGRNGPLVLLPFLSGRLFPLSHTLLSPLLFLVLCDLSFLRLLNTVQHAVFTRWEGRILKKNEKKENERKTSEGNRSSRKTSAVHPVVLPLLLLLLHFLLFFLLHCFKFFGFLRCL